MNQLTQLRGVIPPLVTPLTKAGNIDEKAFRTLIRRMLTIGVNGLFILGSSGEFACLTDDQKTCLVEVAIDEIGNKVPLLVGVGDTSTARVLKNIERLTVPGVSGIVVCPPYFFPLSDRAIEEFYKVIARTSQVPVILYNVPQTTKNWISINTIGRLVELENIVGIKDSSGDMAHFQRLLEVTGEKQSFAVFQGDERVMGLSILAGAAGIVPGLANVDPKLCLELYEYAVQGDVKGTIRLQMQLVELSALYQTASSPVGGLKTALNLMDYCEQWLTHPLDCQRLESEHIGISKILKECGLL